MATTTDHDIITDEGPLSDFIRATDEARAVARPTAIGEFYIEREHREAEDEQRAAYARQGEAQSRPAAAQTAALDHAADKAIAVSEDKHRLAVAGRKRYDTALTVLSPLVRRPTDAKILKWARWGLILGGDTAGIAGAALLLGEEPLNAFMQATSAAIAAVTLGAVGREIRYMVAARAWAKKPDDLTEGERIYAGLFVGPRSGETLIKALVLVCATGIMLIGVGIFALRSSAEGSAAGIVFGCLAVALGLASFYNSFDTADDVAELLDNEKARLHEIEQGAVDASGAEVIKSRAMFKTQAASIRAENTKAGDAAAAGVRRHLQSALGNSPGIAGNGTAHAPAPRTNGAKVHVDTTARTNGKVTS